MKVNINRIEDELEKLGYTIEGADNYEVVSLTFLEKRDAMFWEAIELLQGYDDNQIMENFAEFLHDRKRVQKNE